VISDTHYITVERHNKADRQAQCRWLNITSV
jgi:hypothetical protein